MGGVIVNPNVKDTQIRKIIYTQITQTELSTAVEECQYLVRPADDYYFDFFAKYYSQIQQFSPKMLAILNFRSKRKNHSLLQAIEFLKQLDEDGKRKITPDAPLTCIPKKWMNFVIDEEGNLNRKYYLVKTVFIVKFLRSEEYRRIIHKQLNKGEAIHALRAFIFFAHEGKIRKRQRKDPGQSSELFKRHSIPTVRSNSWMRI